MYIYVYKGLKPKLSHSSIHPENVFSHVTLHSQEGQNNFQSNINKIMLRKSHHYFII